MERQFKETAGIPWASQYGINPSKQDDVLMCVIDSYLAERVDSAAVLATKNYIYVLGGYSSNGALNNIQRVSFNDDELFSDLDTDFENDVKTLPIAMAGMGYVAAKNRLYLIGGYNASGELSSVYSVLINEDGTLGEFREETLLPTSVYYAACFVIKDKLYLVGGWKDEDNLTNTVYRTTINSDGTLSDWEILPEFPVPFCHGAPLLIKDRIYIVGAYNEYYKTSEIYYATYDSDGNIGPWVNVGSMPKKICGSAVVCNDNYVFSFTGYSLDDSDFVHAMYKAPILPNGDLGEWKKAHYMAYDSYFVKPVIAGNKIYLIGGWDGEKPLSSVSSGDFTSGITDYTPYFSD